MPHRETRRRCSVRLGPWLVPLLLIMLGVKARTSGPKPSRDDPVENQALAIAISVHGGQATVRMPATNHGGELLIITSVLSQAPGPFPIRLDLEAGDRSSSPPGDVLKPLPRIRLGHHQPAPARPPATGIPPRNRSFHVMVRNGDVTSASNYAAVPGVLRAVGRHIQVFVAADDLGLVDEATLKDVVSTFDNRIYPEVSRAIGDAYDVDRDGRFTVLFSSWLGRLGSGRHAVDGFVRVTDLDPSYSHPFGNRCDMMYLSAGLSAGPYLRTIMAHEYMHSVGFSQKCLAASGRTTATIEEEGWLDEAIAHLGEDLLEFSRSNLDYRLSAYLSCPERYGLVVEDYYEADLFRSHGHRGATYLFLRWCADQYGPELLPALARSRWKGTANLEGVTGIRFADLFRRWTVALFLSGLSHDAGAVPDPYRTLSARSPMSDYELAGPRFTRLRPGDPPDRWQAAGTSTHYTVVPFSGSGRVVAEVKAPEAAKLQVTAVILPRATARLDLSARACRGSNGEPCIAARVRESGGGGANLTGLAWEQLIPPADPHAPGFRRGGLDSLGIASKFGTSTLAAGAELRSGPIPVELYEPRTWPLVLKLVGTDNTGHRVAAWCQVDSGADQPPVASPFEISRWGPDTQAINDQ